MISLQPIISAPYSETFGMFRDDPTFSDFLKEVEQYRREADESEDTTLLTRNRRDFQQVPGLVMEDWTLS